MRLVFATDNFFCLVCFFEGDEVVVFLKLSVFRQCQICDVCRLVDDYSDLLFLIFLLKAIQNAHTFLRF